MYRKVLVGGMTAAAILGAGGTALALTGSGTASTGAGTTASATGSARPGHAKGKARLFRHLSHGVIVTHGKNGFVTHDFIKGAVTAVSATSITVQAADKTTQTFVVNKDTKVRVRSGGKGAASTIAKVAKGDQVILGGTGTSTRTAKHIVDVKKK
jgi:hypothetical protein